MITRLFILRRSSLRFLPPVAAFLFSAIAGISVAAWLDAPNAPPNYGLTPPYTQDDFRPMNLGTAPQVKNAGVEFIGGVTATHFVDGNSPYFTDASLPLYQLDLASSGEAGLVKGRLGIGATSTQAKLTVNNPATQDKWGSMSDAIYAYADNSIYGMSTVLSLEQGSPTGYALYSSGGINYFGGNVGIGTTTPGYKLDVADGSIQATGVSGGQSSIYINKPASTDAQALTFRTGGTDKWNIGVRANETYLEFWDSPAGTNMLTLTTVGNVGIGTVSPQANLHVGGDARIDGPANTCKAVPYTNTTSYDVDDPPHVGVAPPTITTSCGANFYVFAVIDDAGHFGDPNAPPQTGKMLCCKNAD